MNEENAVLNQEQTEEVTPEIIFDDEVSENTNEGTEVEEKSEEPEVQTEEQEEESTSDVEEFLRVKYNGEEKALSQEEAIVLAQKGMNYDKINEKLQELSNSPALKLINDQAESMGITVDEYVQRLEQFNQQTKLNDIAASYKEKYPDVSDEAAYEYAQLALAQEKTAYQQKQEQKLIEQQQGQQAEVERQMKEFFKEYPDVDVEKIPDEVFTAVDNGETLLSAYRAHENKVLREKLNAERKNSENRNKAVGNLNENANDKVASDPFLQGLLM